MRIVLDAGGTSALATQPHLVAAFRRRYVWPAVVPAIVLTEALTGDHRRDHAANRFLKTCEIRRVEEALAREAARLRTSTGRAGTISATDAIVAACAASCGDALVLTSDPRDLRALAVHASGSFSVAAI